MQIVWLGHGSFRIEIEDQVLLVDPWLTGNPVLPEDQHEAAVNGGTHLLLTHAHFDHIADMQPLSKKLGIPVVGQYDLLKHWGENLGFETIGFNKGGTVMAGNVAISMVPASHSSSISTENGPNVVGSEVGYMIAGEGHVIYVSGDTAVMADMDWMGDYYKPDIGILSAGGHFTMDMKGATYAARRYFNFKTVFPCHYKTFPLLEQPAEVLISGLPGVNVIEPEVMKPIVL